MNHKTSFICVCALILVISVVGCSASATPTKPAPTAAPQVITVVITPTALPPTATPLPATITPIPTIAVTPTVQVSTPVALKATAAPVTPRATATKKPVTTTVPVTPTATVLPVKYTAPSPIEPIFNDNRKDERHFPGDALTFKWASLGGLNGDECYSLRVDFVPATGPAVARGDTFLTNCGDQTAKDYPVGFTLNKPTSVGPNYSALLPESSEIWVNWTVTVVRDLGAKAGETKHATAPVSPTSAKVQFLLKGG